MVCTKTSLGLKDRRRVSLPLTLEPAAHLQNPMSFSDGIGDVFRVEGSPDHDSSEIADSDTTSSETTTDLRDLDCDFLQRYEVGKAVGHGTTSVVRQVIRRSDGKRLVVKIIRNEDEEVRRFTRDEFELLKSLSHTNIVRAEELIMTPSSMIRIVMEYCEDGSVDRYVHKNGPFQEERSCALFHQLLEGIHYLHGKRIVHRDLKPANLVLASEASCIKITDFNSARRIGAAETCNQIMLTLRGTHFYNAPEMRFGGLWNERVDVWACGLCLYFMLKTRPPFNSDNSSVSAALLTGVLPSTISWQGVTSLMRNLVEQCLTVAMSDRPTAMELLLHPVFASPEESQSCRSVELKGSRTSLRRRAASAPPRLHQELLSTKSTQSSLLLAESQRDRLKKAAFASEPVVPSKAVNLRSLKAADSESYLWRESRYKLDTLHRLMQNRCERTMKAAAEGAPEIVGKKARRKLAVKKDSRRYFTTNGASQFLDDSLAPAFNN